MTILRPDPRREWCHVCIAPDRHVVVLGTQPTAGAVARAFEAKGYTVETVYDA